MSCSVTLGKKGTLFGEPSLICTWSLLMTLQKWLVSTPNNGWSLTHFQMLFGRVIGGFPSSDKSGEWILKQRHDYLVDG